MEVARRPLGALETAIKTNYKLQPPNNEISYLIRKTNAELNREIEELKLPYFAVATLKCV